jgi:hypothetical protein
MTEDRGQKSAAHNSDKDSCMIGCRAGIYPKGLKAEMGKCLKNISRK